MGITTDPRLFYRASMHLRNLGLHEYLKCLSEIECKGVLECVARAVALCNNVEEEITIGVDPGKISGVVAIVGTTPIYFWEGPENEVVSILVKLSKELKVKSIFIGDGYPLDIGTISNVNVKIVRIPEHSSSKRKLKGFKRHTSSAYIIATRLSLSRNKKIDAD